MKVIWISFCIGVWIVLLISLIEDLLFGDRGKRGQISEYFAELKGDKNRVNANIKSKRNIKFENSKDIKCIFLTVIVCVVIFFITYIAFRSIIMALIISMFGLAYPKILKDKEKKKKKKLIDEQFIDALDSIRSSIKAGLSVNSAFIKCADDLERLYKHKREKPMLEELKKIKKDLGMGIPVESVLKDFSNRVKTEDVDDFVNSIIVVRQKGGNIVEVINNITTCITDKIDIKKEIEVQTTSKRAEAKIVSVMPVAMVVIISIISPEYMKSLYGTGIGKILIIFAVILLVVNYFVNKRIVDIEV